MLWAPAQRRSLGSGTFVDSLGTFVPTGLCPEGEAVSEDRSGSFTLRAKRGTGSSHGEQTPDLRYRCDVTSSGVMH